VIPVDFLMRAVKAEAFVVIAEARILCVRGRAVGLRVVDNLLQEAPVALYAVLVLQGHLSQGKVAKRLHGLEAGAPIADRLERRGELVRVGGARLVRVSGEDLVFAQVVDAVAIIADAAAQGGDQIDTVWGQRHDAKHARTRALPPPSLTPVASQPYR
jgi:hypothetical protein